ncbi:MAG: PAS domain S-box protein [Deltaproteobacteria bacterium]|nr:PAS domain S-box protein [Deltaproteobacteria bacterium]
MRETNQPLEQSIRWGSGADTIDRLIDAAPFAVVVIEKDGTIVRFGGEAEQLFGWTEAEMLGRSVDELLPERIRSGHAAMRNGFFGAPSARRMGARRALHAVHRDGREFRVEVALGPLVLDGVPHAVAYISDVSERVAVEERNARLYDEIMELHSPILEVWRGVLTLPLMGTVDTHRAQVAMEKSLQALQEHQADVLIIDITGVSVVDTGVANHLIRLADAVRLMGGRAILSGISPAIAQTIVRLGVKLDFETAPNLGAALRRAVRLVDGAGAVA